MRISDWSSDVCSSDLSQTVDIGIEIFPRHVIGAFVDEIVGHEVLHRRKQDVACVGHSFPHSKGDRRTIAPGGAGCQWTASRSLRALPSVSSLLSWWVLVRAKAVMPCTKS